MVSTDLRFEEVQQLFCFGIFQYQSFIKTDSDKMMTVIRLCATIWICGYILSVLLHVMGGMVGCIAQWDI